MESDTFAQAKARKKRGSRGKEAEDKVHEVLTDIMATDMNFDFDRLLDSRSAGRIVAPSVADFTFCYHGLAGALEVKQTNHAFRLKYSDFPQFPRMRRRAAAGGLSILVVYHTKEKLWRIIDVMDLEVITRASWDLSKVETHSGELKLELLSEMEYWRMSRCQM